MMKIVMLLITAILGVSDMPRNWQYNYLDHINEGYCTWHMENKEYDSWYRQDTKDSSSTVVYEIYMQARTKGTRVDEDNSSVWMTIFRDTLPETPRFTNGGTFQSTQYNLIFEWTDVDGIKHQFSHATRANATCDVGNTEVTGAGISSSPFDLRYDGVDKTNQVGIDIWKQWLYAESSSLKFGEFDTWNIEKQYINDLRAWWEHLEEGCDGTH